MIATGVAARGAHRMGGGGAFALFALLLEMVLAALAFGTLAALAMILTRGEGGITAVWLPNAVAVVLFVRVRFRHPEAIFAATTLGNLAASLFVGDTLPRAAGLASCNAAEIAVAVILVGRWCGARPEMDVLRAQMRFIAATALVAPVISATLALAIIQPASMSGAFAIWSNWALTDGLGMLIVAPAGMIFSAPGRKWTAAIPRRAALEWTVLAVLGTAVALLVFVQTQYPFLFLVLPVVLFHAFRQGMIGTAICVINVAIIAIVCTWLGFGPINLIAQSLATKLVVLQLFLATAFTMGLPVAAALAGQERLLARIRENEEQLALIAENVSDAVMRIALDGTCEFASPSAADVFAAPLDRIVGSNVLRLVAAEDVSGLRALGQAIIAGTADRGLRSFRSRNHARQGKIVWAEVSCGLVRDALSGAPKSYIVSARDVTARVELEALMDRARRHAENAAAAKSQFLANISHEIRTPMNGVLGFAELMLSDPLPEKTRRHARLIVESGKAMMRLLNDVLDFSKIEAGQVAITLEPVALHDLIEDCARLMSANAEQKGLTLEAVFAADVPAEIVCDSLRLRQIVLNLIGNAVKFTAEGGVRIDVAVRGDPAAATLEIAVSDTGIGIPEIQIDAIFRPFEQGENSVSRRYGGTGLGLSISRQLAGLLGGTLSAHSSEGSGARFILALPLAEPLPGPMATTRGAAEHRERPAPPPALSLPVLPPVGYRILLAEDHDINRLLAREMLERLGQRVTVAVDGSEAVAAVLREQRAERPFDLVLMDVQMPVCDGYAATRAIRAAGIGADLLPIAALTANAYAEDVAQAKAAGMQEHLAKPLDFAALAALLARMLPAGRIGAENQPPRPAWSAPASGDPLMLRWQERRAEALAQLAAFVRSDSASGAALEELAAAMHKLAGSAGMFGEGALGDRARAVEDAIRSAQPRDTVTALAATILRAA